MKRRHLWPGLDLSRVGPGRSAAEIIDQVRRTRDLPGARGNICWGIRALTENRRGLADTLLHEVYAQPALPPAFPWLDAQPPGQPQISVLGVPGDETRVACNPAALPCLVSWIPGVREG